MISSIKKSVAAGLVLFLATTLVMTLLTGCGQKGPLTLPPPAAAAPAAAASAAK